MTVHWRVDTMLRPLDVSSTRLSTWNMFTLSGPGYRRFWYACQVYLELCGVRYLLFALGLDMTSLKY